MIKFRVIYWLGSIKTDVIIKAEDKYSALLNFYRIKGIHPVVSIEEGEE